MERKLAVFALLLMTAFMMPLARADYAQTQVWFTVASSTSFTVTLPGQGAVSSSGTAPPGAPPTADVWFNSSSTSNASIMPCVTGGTACQTSDMSTTPIFQYKNTGTANINLYMTFNTTLPSGITVGMNSSTNDTTATAHALIWNVNSTANATIVTNLTWTNGFVANAFVNATFTAVPGGTSTRLLHHISS